MNLFDLLDNSAKTAFCNALRRAVSSSERELTDEQLFSAARQAWQAALDVQQSKHLVVALTFEEFANSPMELKAVSAPAAVPTIELCVNSMMAHAGSCSPYTTAQLDLLRGESAIVQSCHGREIDSYLESWLEQDTQVFSSQAREALTQAAGIASEVMDARVEVPLDKNLSDEALSNFINSGLSWEQLCSKVRSVALHEYQEGGLAMNTGIAFYQLLYLLEQTPKVFESLQAAD